MDLVHFQLKILPLITVFLGVLITSLRLCIRMHCWRTGHSI